MKVFIGVLVLCGIYSSHAASVGFSVTSPCTNEDYGALLPVVGECSEFYMCVKGEALKKSCGSTLHFDPISKKCIEISQSKCISGKNEADRKPQEIVVKVDAKPQSTESQMRPQPEEPKEKQTQSEIESKPEKAIPSKIQIVLPAEEAKPQQAELKAEVEPKPEEPKEKQTQSEIESKPEKAIPSKIQIVLPAEKAKPQQAEIKVKVEPKPVESRPQEIKAELKPEETKKITPSDFCLGKPVGTFVPSKLSCNQYYICLGNRFALKKCPADLHFNAELNSCTSPEMANCLVEPESNVQAQVEENSIAEEKPEEQIQPEDSKPAPEAAAVSPKKMCEGQTNGAMIPVSGSCSSFLVCLGDEVFELSCGDQHFDPIFRVCISAEKSACVESKIAILKADEALGGFVGDTYMGNGTDGVVVGNANVEITNTGSVSNLNLVSSSSNIAVGNTDLGFNNEYQVSGISSPEQNKLETPTGFAEIQLTSTSVGNTDLGQNNSGIIVDNANVNINNTGKVTNANIVVASQKVEVGNTNLGSFNSYVVNGSSVVVNNKSIPLKQSGLPVNKKQVSNIEQVDIDVSSSGVALNAQGVTEELDVGNTDMGQDNKGIVIGNANIKISNSGTVKDVNVVSGVQNSVIGNTDLGAYNSVGVEEVAVAEAELKENRETVVAIIDEENISMCVGVPSGTLFPKAGNCQNFLTCEEGVAYLAACPHGLHFNAQSNICDWPELAGCA